MSEQVKDVVEGASSDATATSETPAGPQPATTAQDDTRVSSPEGDAAAPPAVEQGDEPKSALEAATKAIAKDDAAKAEAEDKGTEQPGEKPDAGKEDPKGEVDPEDLTEAEVGKLSTKAQNRFRALSRKAKEADERATTAEARLAASEPAAQNFQALQGYMKSNNLVGEEIQQGIEIMALMKNNPIKALEMLKPHLDNLNAFVGNTLPADLQRQVDGGEMTDTVARELVRTRNEAARTAAAAQRTQEENAHRSERANASQAATDMSAALDGYERDLMAQHPNYSAVRQLFHDKVKLAMLESRPKNPEEARAVAKTAWESVQSTVKGLGLTPKPAATAVTTDGKAPAPAKPQAPKTAMEAVDIALAGRSAS